MRHSLPERDESGAIAILTALLMVVVLAVAALGVDIATQVNERQKLHDTIDAAAHAGAYRLPSSGATAASDAKANALANDPDLTGALIPTVNLYCVVASKLVSGSYAVDTSQIPATCNPVSAGGAYTVSSTLRCNSKICAIPCNGGLDVCNTVKVSDTKDVAFAFAPAIGINQGSTGSVSSAACKGSCGTVPLNPMDIAVVADRTGSMSDTNRNAMVAGIKSMFEVMTPSQQYVSLGTIGRSKLGAATTCLSEDSSDDTVGPTSDAGPWIPVPFSNDYLMPGTATINTNSTLIKAVNCLTSSSTGTHLASPMKAAARYLLGPSSPYDSTTIYPTGAPARTGTIRKAIIFETDGAPNESSFSGTPGLGDAVDVGSTSGTTACNNLNTVATNAKAPGKDILVVTVAYNITTSTKCNGSSGARVDQTLAAAASPGPSGASAADFNCADAGGRNSENRDGDYFFCAGTGTDMREIFVTAFTQIANGIRLIALP